MRSCAAHGDCCACLSLSLGVNCLLYRPVQQPTVVVPFPALLLVLSCRRPCVCSPSTGFVLSGVHKLIADSRARQTEKRTNSGETARLSEELFSMLSAEGAKPDDEAVMEKIEGLEVRASPALSCPTIVPSVPSPSLPF